MINGPVECDVTCGWTNFVRFWNACVDKYLVRKIAKVGNTNMLHSRPDLVFCSVAK